MTRIEIFLAAGDVIQNQGRQQGRTVKCAARGLKQARRDGTVGFGRKSVYFSATFQVSRITVKGVGLPEIGRVRDKKVRGSVRPNPKLGRAIGQEHSMLEGVRGRELSQVVVRMT